MPLPITFDWHEDEHMLYFVLHVKGAKSKNVDIALCDVYVKVNCYPSLFEVDLLREIDPEDPKTRCKVGDGRVNLSLKKKEPGLWNEFRATGTKPELRERRKTALANSAAREQERQTLKEDRKLEMIKSGEHEQWRLDREQREKIEEWELEEKRQWEEDMFASFDAETGMSLEPEPIPVQDGDLDAPDETDGVSATPKEKAYSKVAEVTDEEADRIRSGDKDVPSLIKPGNGAIWSDKDLDDTEEYMPDVREKDLKVGIQFSARPRMGVPVRDRGQNRAPPHPKGQVKSEQPAMMIGDTQEDETDPVWLKDKADTLMVSGDFQGAHNAYTEALKIAANSRAFGNRAVASLYMGNFEACIEDSTHCIRILDVRNKRPSGEMPHPEDPQDALVRARAEIKIGTAYLWLGAFGKSEQYFQRAIDCENGLEFEDLKIVKEDLKRVKAAKAALLLKDKADTAVRRAAGGGDRERDALESSLTYYDEAVAEAEESAGVRANRCFAKLRAGKLEASLEDGEAAIGFLKRWPVATRAPKKPAKPARLDPPYVDDPTFKHPDEAVQKEHDWLMKHGGGTKDNLPSLPPEYEWVKDAAEKDQWIAIRKKMTQRAIDTVKRNTRQLQDAVYARNHKLIREAIVCGLDTNRVGEGPSDRALRQAEDYAQKVEDYEKERDLEKQKDDELLRQELEECDLEQQLTPNRSGVAQTGFSRAHPVEKTRRRLFVKTLLRQARAHELLGDAKAGLEKLQTALRVEPDNPEAKQRLSILSYSPAPDKPAPKSPAPSWPQSAAMSSTATPASASSATPVSTAKTGSDTNGRTESTSSGGGKAKKKERRQLDDDDDEDEQGPDHASTQALIQSAADYMKKNDYASALQIYSYARNRTKVWESPLVELKVLSNACLCLQRVRGRLPELVSACNDVMNRIEDFRIQKVEISEETLLHMESACLARRGSALSQLRRTEESAQDAARVKELMARVREIEAEKEVREIEAEREANS